MTDERVMLFGELVAIVAKLRGEGGCPWDRQQTPESVRPYLVEETYEVLEAMEEGDRRRYAEELGDLMLQVLFHAQMATERGDFTLADVLRGVTAKLIRRHPHVFGAGSAKTAEEVLARWEAIKRDERSGDGSASVLQGVPRHLPALLRAQRIQEKAGIVGFDWNDPTEVQAKVEEEVGELWEAIRSGDTARTEEELGDLLFSLVNLARFLRVNADDALQGGIGRFVERFGFIEAEMRRRGQDLRTTSLAEMDALWNRAKGGGT